MIVQDNIISFFIMRVFDGVLTMANRFKFFRFDFADQRKKSLIFANCDLQRKHIRKKSNCLFKWLRAAIVKRNSY